MFVKQNEARVTHRRKLTDDPIVRILVGVLFVSLGICCYLAGGSCLLGSVLQKSNQVLDHRKHLPIDRVVIDESSFPDGWIATEPNTDFPPLAPWTSGRDEVAYVSRTFYDPSENPSGVAGITIQRFRRIRQAASEYEHEVDVTFRIRDEKNQTSWSIPESLSSFESSSADRYRYACSTISSQVWCSYVAQYEVYTVAFHSSLYDINVFTYTDLLPVFHAIDEHMIFALENAK
jgi:hypothetical protein